MKELEPIIKASLTDTVNYELVGIRKIASVTLGNCMDRIYEGLLCEIAWNKCCIADNQDFIVWAQSTQTAEHLEKNKYLHKGNNRFSP